ncbi:hypothetical protein DAPK24_006760 [Pichia kluyveri]|uniref:Uncharacterized protein n=1 Tax=Pichia kluyveri TaxID=36015 RepID=A0AAV5QXT2_PICKL|nr:hypothetical protein DAPK24_006760 [Pichia kluyveri]
MFNGKSTIITGANKNLGKQTAIEFAKEGSNILLHYHLPSSANETEQLAKLLINDYNINAIIFGGNLSQEDITIELFDIAIEKFGKIDYAINNVGLMIRKPLFTNSLDEYNKMFDINVKASFLFLKYSELKLSEKGSVVMLTTSLLSAYTEGFSLYQASKAAVYWMCKTASKETQKKITFNCISPGPMNTPFLSGKEDESRINFLKNQAIEKRLTDVDDIVPIIKFIVKDGKWMTGQNLFANNGFLAPSA